MAIDKVPHQVLWMAQSGLRVYVKKENSLCIGAASEDILPPLLLVEILGPPPFPAGSGRCY